MSVRSEALMSFVHLTDKLFYVSRKLSLTTIFLSPRTTCRKCVIDIQMDPEPQVTISYRSYVQHSLLVLIRNSLKGMHLYVCVHNTTCKLVIAKFTFKSDDIQVIFPLIDITLMTYRPVLLTGLMNSKIWVMM